MADEKSSPAERQELYNAATLKSIRAQEETSRNTNKLLEKLIDNQDNAKKKEEESKPEMDDPKYEGVLTSMLHVFQDNLDFARSANVEELMERRKNRAEKRREAASKSGPSGPTMRERISDSISAGKEKVSKGGLKGIAKFITKGLGIAIIAPIIADFVGGLIDGVITEAFGEEAAKKYGGMIKVGGILAVVGGLLFGPMAILPLFFAGILGVLGKKLVDGISDETLKKFGIDKGTLGGVVAAVGAALGLFVPTLLKKAIVGTGRLALKMVKGGAGLAAGAIKTAATGGTAASAGVKTAADAVAKAGGKVPGGMRVNKAGKVIHSNSGKFASADDVMKAMKLEGRAAQVAKYMKFFKFAGPALTVIPALIEPMMAIYNEEGKDEIIKQFAGALGTVGGAYLGGVAGSFLGTGVFPGMGTLVGGLVGMTGGAFLGEDLAEFIAKKVIDGEDADEADLKKARARSRNSRNSRRSGRGGGAKNVTPSKVQVSSQSGGGTKTNLAKSTGARSTAASESKIGVMSDGTQAVIASNQLNVAKGGDTVNSTNVGGNSTTFNIVNGGNNSLANAGHLPVSQAV